MGSQRQSQHSNWTRTATSLVIIFVFFFLTLYSSIFLQWKYLYFSWNNDFKREMCYKCEDLNYSTFYFIINVFLVYICQEKAMATHSSTLAWKIPWTEKPDRLESTGSWRVVHHWATSHSLFTFMHWRRKWQLTPVSCLENPRDGGAWWATIYGVAQSWTRLKQLSSSSSMSPKMFILIYILW